MLHNFEVLSEHDQKEFDEITTLAKIICLTPVALISLFKKDKPWILSVQGIGKEEIDMDHCFCKSVLERPGHTSEIADLHQDAILRDNKYVKGNPNFSFFATVPINNQEGLTIGSISVLDYKPGSLVDHQRKALEILADRTASQIEYRRLIIQQKRDMGATFEKLRTIAAQIPSRILTLNRRLRITYINRLEYTAPENCINHEFSEFMNPVEAERYRRDCHTCLNKGVIVEGHFLIGIQPGHIRWHFVKMCPLRNDRGMITSILVLAEDVHDRMQQEQELIENETRYRDIVENTTDLVLTVNGEGTIMFVNRSWLNLFGFSNVDQIIGRNGFEFVHKDGLTHALQIFEQMKAGDCKIETEIDFVTKSGEKVVCSANLECSYENGSISFLRGILRDITTQKTFESEILKRQLMLNEAQKMSKTGSFEWNLESGRVNWSDEMYTLLGISKERNERMPMAKLYKMVHEDDRERTVRLFENASKLRTESHLEFRLVIDREFIKYVDVKASPFIVYDDQVSVILFTMQDITDARNFEKKVFNAAVQSEERERTRMAGELHDGVCQYLASANLMLDTLQGALNEHVEDWDLKKIAQLVTYSRTSIKEGLNLVRKVSHDLFPTEFYSTGLINSVKQLVNILNSSEGMIYNLNITGDYQDNDYQHLDQPLPDHPGIHAEQPEVFGRNTGRH